MANGERVKIDCVANGLCIDKKIIPGANGRTNYELVLYNSESGQKIGMRTDKENFDKFTLGDYIEGPSICYASNPMFYCKSPQKVVPPAANISDFDDVVNG